MPRSNLTTEEIALRRAEMYGRYLAGETQEDLAKAYGLSRMTVSTDLKKHRATLPLPDVEDMRKTHADLLERMRKSMVELLEMEGAPVTAGKDGNVVMDPVTCAPVRDYSLRINAQRELLKILEREAKQVGVDAATTAKIEHSGQVEVVDSVNAELERLSKSIGLSSPIDPATSSADELTEAP